MQCRRIELNSFNLRESEFCDCECGEVTCEYCNIFLFNVHCLLNRVFGVDLGGEIVSFLPAEDSRMFVYYGVEDDEFRKYVDNLISEYRTRKVLEDKMLECNKVGYLEYFRYYLQHSNILHTSKNDIDLRDAYGYFEGTTCLYSQYHQDCEYNPIPYYPIDTRSPCNYTSEDIERLEAVTSGFRRRKKVLRRVR